MPNTTFAHSNNQFRCPQKACTEQVFRTNTLSLSMNFMATAHSNLSFYPIRKAYYFATKVMLIRWIACWTVLHSPSRLI